MRFNSSNFLNGIRHLLKDFATKVLMRDCPTTEPNADFNLVTFFKELGGVLESSIEICLTYGWA